MFKESYSEEIKIKTLQAAGLHALVAEEIYLVGTRIELITRDE